MKDSDNKLFINAEREHALRQASLFIEELSWLIESFNKSKKDFNLKEISQILRNASVHNDHELSIRSDEFKSTNPNIHYLIGILPRLFQDRMLFRTNDEIGEFASEVLGIDISRVDKRSKYELIGLIVCETNDLSDRKLSMLVDSLRSITENEEKMKIIADAKNDKGFSWNIAIRSLSGY